ncbi:hypothetical protein NP233_g5251 [Leucocoprinus birnbaumii]|uniref:Uncharacterized protein n=1 Tax=Leucocoprinus birnbaumii TaxID=56174 RepID=A0AAD5VT72_9AGAR|nr:hypothetical protein NP233_g5251 [Leucocoprinus birnbaumii]
MDSSNKAFVHGRSNASRKGRYSHLGPVLLGKRMAHPPPRFLRAPSDILGYPPSHSIPIVNKAQHAWQHGQTMDPIPSAQKSIQSPWLTNAPGNLNHASFDSPVTMPRQAVHQPVDWITPPPSPTADQCLREPSPPDFVVNPRIPGPCHAYTPPVLVARESYLSPSPAARMPSDDILQPAPRRPILLPDVKVPFKQSGSQLPRGSYAQKSESTNSSTHFDQADYSFDIDVIFRKDSQFLNTKATAKVPPNYSAADLLSSIAGEADSDAHGITRELAFLDRGLTTLSIGTQHQLQMFSNIKLIMNLIRQRFGCFLTPELFKKVFRTMNALPDPLSSFDASQPSDFYTKKVRLWATNVTGPTIFEEIMRALEPGTHPCNERFTLSYFWFVLFVRELLIRNKDFAMITGTLIRLGADNLNPCSPCFHFFALESAIRHHMADLGNRYRTKIDETTIQQREIRKCKKGHFQIVMSDQPFYNFYRLNLAARPDKTEYQIAFRDWFLKLVNESRDAFTAFVLATFLNTEKTQNDADDFIIRY